jgi:hypothetical protein
MSRRQLQQFMGEPPPRSSTLVYEIVPRKVSFIGGNIGNASVPAGIGRPQLLARATAVRGLAPSNRYFLLDIAPRCHLSSSVL